MSQVANLSNAPIAWNETSKEFMHTGNTINLPAMLSVVLLTIILAGGMKMSSVVINS